MILIAIAVTLLVTASMVWLIASKKINSKNEDLATLRATNIGLNDNVSRLESIKQKNEIEVEKLTKSLSESNIVLAKESQARKSADDQLSKSTIHIEQAQKKIDELQSKLSIVNSDLSALKAEQAERDISHQKQLKQFEDQKESLKKEFENLANKIFEEKGKTFSETSQTSLDMMLKPFKQQIEGFQDRINKIHDESIKGNTTLESEIKKVLDVGLKMQEEANNLTSALKGDSQQRGGWGEAQLERTLQMSGLVEGAHYDAQESFKDSEGKTKRTDYVIKLPDGKHLIIDSKVSLVAYDQAVSASSEEEVQIALNDHYKAVRQHIDDLAAKDYTNLIGVNSPNFVLMFMPIEPAYIEALKHKKDLYGYGYEKGVVLVSHTTLIPILRIVSNLWMLEQSGREARELGDKALDIYNQVCMVTERLHKLGGTLNTAGKQYTETVTSLVGQQGLHGKVERFGQLSSKIKRTMSEITPIHLDVEDPRLLLEAKPLIESDVAEILNHDESAIHAEVGSE